MLEEFPIRSSGRDAGASPSTLRRDKFKDPRVRRAFNYAFDFEEMNKQIFFGQYKRIGSYFEGTELAWRRGLPQGKELEILETVRDKVPPEVFTTAYTNPVGGNPEAVRDNLREALRLLKEAGYEVRDRKLVDAKTGDAVRARVPGRRIRASNGSCCSTSRRWNGSASPSACAPSTTRNTRTGCAAGTSTSSPTSWGESLSPGNEQREFWGSQAADMAGSRNIIGIKNPAIDTLIERVIFAKDRDELVAATKALDRVLLWNYYVVPQWTYGKSRTARWDRFGRPAELPKYGLSGVPDHLVVRRREGGQDGKRS